MLHTSVPELIEQIAWLIPRLPPPAQFTLRCEADYYGASHEIARALRLPSPPMCSASWRHGWSRFPGSIPEMVATCGPGSRVHLMPDAHHERLLLDAGYPNAIAVGYPLLYCPSPGLPRRPRSLLAAPFHLLPEITPHQSQLEFEHAFAEYLAGQRVHFETVCACLHSGCLELGLWTRTLEQHGIPWILGARTDDANGLRRVRTLLECFDCVVTNHAGSIMPYAAHLGARVCVAGPSAPLPEPDAFARHPTYQKYPEALERLKRLREIPLSQDLPFLLQEPAEASCPKAWADESVGSAHQIPHDAIARLLGWRHTSATLQPPSDRRRLLIALGSTPIPLADAEDREKIGRLLAPLSAPVSRSLETSLKDRDRLQKQCKSLSKQSGDAEKWRRIRRSWTWRLIAKPLFALERWFRPSLADRQTPVASEESANSD